jgi:hypothetical protein
LCLSEEKGMVKIMKKLASVLLILLTLFLSGCQKKNSNELVADVSLRWSTAKVIEKSYIKPLSVGNIKVEIISTTNDNLKAGEIVNVVYTETDESTKIDKLKTGDIVQIDNPSSDIDFEQSPPLIHATKLIYPVKEKDE